MIEFQPVRHEKMDLLKEIVNANHAFHTLSEDHPELTDEEILVMYESSKGQGAVMNFLGERKKESATRRPT
ncbi:hypothetical protein JI721_14235 [Alicyclobacillus cycloheptanicus]|uniref:Trehalose-6-phosphate synthase n=1 Tax=Alicyclobacillus cycloheptanicus TaxID=1457 RepID=A0ABT9XMI3_9BACL|nr:hypothetical protein [Alicyclobacillus cycloheptanicus]MDQ0191432.1 trehalose-6-phosphate synthase [Alicyclobacillus cycloheptanicus]WDM00832.1 hypothetical protein JI721_14235 [Alicyclobacillus cycloheptanicus]